MKKLWVNSSEKVQNEINVLIQNKTALFCLRNREKAVKKLYPVAVTFSSGTKLLVLNHPHEPSCGKAFCTFYYHREKKPIRYFECNKVRKVGDYLGLEFPSKIFQLQRRRNPRIVTPNDSSAVFSFKHRQRLYHAKLEDVSLSGAKLTTDLPSLIPTGEIVEPLTLTLLQRFHTGEETKIVIPEAIVTWISADDERTKQLGLKFSLKERSLQSMGDYIDTRLMEELPDDSVNSF